MPAAAFACPTCGFSHRVEEGTPEVVTTCPGCQSQLDAFFFPAFYRPREIGAAAATVVDPTEASCFYHPQKQAARVCEGCGRLICSLCSVDMGSQHLCPACISSGQKKQKITTLESSRTRYDNIALGLALASIIMSFFSLVLSPAAIYIAIRHWKNPGGLGGRGRVRMGIAIVIGLATFIFWGGVLGAAFYGATLHPQHVQPQ